MSAGAAANEQLVRSFVEALNAKALDRLEEFLAPAYRDHGGEGIEELRQGFEEWYLAFPDHRTTIDLLLTDGDLVATRSTVRATHAGSYADADGTGRRIEFGAHEFYRIERGRIVEHWEVWDEAALLRQLGRL